MSAVALIVLTIYVVRAFDSRRMPELAAEHRVFFDSEFSAADEPTTDWARYLDIEQALQAELSSKIPGDQRAANALDRYWPGGVTWPGKFDGNWNHSFELQVPQPRGYAVLLHGLSDSPYTMLSTAQSLAGSGYGVIVPRMPGHGFAVSGLLQVGSADWLAAARIAIRHAMSRLAADHELLLVGYSNGGLIALNYALSCGDFDGMRCPDRMLFLSPAISVTRSAAVANWHSAISWIPYFERFKWLGVYPEIDPFKFTSFPKKTGWEIHTLSKQTHELLQDNERSERLPPILTFQSVVDNTVSSSAVINTLYDRLPDNGSELVLYDVNRNSSIVALMRQVPDDPVADLMSLAPLNYDVTILGNETNSGLRLQELRLAARSNEILQRPTDLDWPFGIYSLSHIAIPFRPDDPLYGDGSGAGRLGPGLVLGNLAPRGELGVLLLTPSYFLRTRYNPFYRYQAQLIRNWLAAR
ncbi:MAG: alpha/beta fold hydrolase [Gammaproteobacteria bacterium]|nr:alpha/beta fold hydrolase [Gammaproteobacteria bacterium]